MTNEETQDLIRRLRKDAVLSTTYEGSAQSALAVAFLEIAQVLKEWQRQGFGR